MIAALRKAILISWLCLPASIAMWLAGGWRLRWLAEHRRDLNDALGILLRTLGGIGVLSSLMMLCICYYVLRQYHRALKRMR